MNGFFSYLRAEHRSNPWMLPGVVLSAAAAFGSWLGQVLA